MNSDTLLPNYADHTQYSYKNERRSNNTFVLSNTQLEAGRRRHQILKLFAGIAVWSVSTGAVGSYFLRGDLMKSAPNKSYFLGSDASKFINMSSANSSNSPVKQADIIASEKLKTHSLNTNTKESNCHHLPDITEYKNRMIKHALCYASRYPDLYRKYCHSDLTKCNIDLLEYHNLKFREPGKNRTWGCDPSQDQAFHADTFLNTVKRNQSLPICVSGSEFLSTDGGRWVQESSLKKNKNKFALGYNPKYLKPCLTKNYTDPYVWSSKCAIPDIPDSIKINPKRVILIGDSLAYQQMTAIATQSKQIQKNTVPQKTSLHNVQFNIRQMLNPVLTSVPFISSVCQICDKSIGKELYDKEITPLSDEEFLAVFKDYDFIFYNEFAHFVSYFLEPLHKIYMDQAINTYSSSHSDNISEHLEKNITEQFLKDAFDYFERQINRKAELLAATGAKAYFRTSSPHAYDNPILYKNLTDRSAPTRLPANNDISLMHCGSFNGDKHGAACYSRVNDIASRAFLSHGLGVLDTAKMLSQRVDAHPGSVPGIQANDLLHFCQPGPISVVVAAMLTEVYAQSV